MRRDLDTSTTGLQWTINAYLLALAALVLAIQQGDTLGWASMLVMGSAAAEDELSRLAPGVADQVERVVREAYVYAFDGAMVLCLAVSLAGVLAAFLVAGKSPQPVIGRATGSPTPETERA
jgi:hypothetical protein